MEPKRRVVVTGLGVATPIGIGVDPFWEALVEQRCGISRVEAFDPAGLASQIAGELPSFKLGDFIPKTYRKSIKVMSRDIKIAVICAYHAVTDAGLRTKCLLDRGEAPAPANVDSTRFGANIGAGLICADLNELAAALTTAADADGVFDLKTWGGEGMENLTPLWLLKFLPNMLACHVTIIHDAQAPSNTITCGEASSHLAIGEAYRTIARGDADVCICGGAEGRVNPMALARRELLGLANTTTNDNPTRACQPFGADRAGVVPAEGGGLVILESLDHAKARAVRIYAEFVGFGASSDSYHWSKPDPAGRAVTLALQKAMTSAGIDADQVQLAVPFGTGALEGDASEIAGWNAAFGDRLATIPALTTSGAMGTNGAGAGAVDFAATVLAVHRNMVPASLNTDQLDSTCRFRFQQNDPVDAKITHAVSSGHALAGGQIGAVVIKRYEE